MKLYLVSANECPLNSIWAGSQADAAAARKQLIERGAKRKDLMTSEVEVPTKKEELIAFLNLLAEGHEAAAASQRLTAR